MEVVNRKITFFGLKLKKLLCRRRQSFLLSGYNHLLLYEPLILIHRVLFII